MGTSQMLGLPSVDEQKPHGGIGTGLFQLSGNDQDSYTPFPERIEYDNILYDYCSTYNE
jgi:hypothetical protein